MSIFKEFTKGFWKENPVLVLVLGMCPTLATSSFFSADAARWSRTAVAAYQTRSQTAFEE